MKLFTKLMSLAIAFCMLIPTAGFADYKDVDYDEYYAEALELLTTLDIFEGDENGNFNPGKTITRAEMAAIVCRAKGLDDAAKASKGVTRFSDVSAEHWASGYINIASQSGIINGYGNGCFGPDDELTYEQAVKMLVCALGFEPMAQSRGGWPSGYLIVANTYKITEGVSSRDGAIRSSLAVLTYNALSAPMMDQTSWGTDAGYEVLDGKGFREYKTLLTDRDIYLATGIVGDKNYDEVTFEITEDSLDMEFDEGDIESFEINGSDIVNYKYQNVDVYVEKHSRNSYRILAVVSAVEGTTLTIVSDDIKSYDANKITYYVDSSSSSKTKTVKLLASPEVEYNKANYTESLDTLFNTEDVEIKLVENTGDTTYDVVMATKYLSARVENVDADRNRITIDGKTITLDFDDDEISIILENDRGIALDLDDFEEDDVVAVVADNTNIKNYVDYIRIIRLDDAVVRGEVDQTYSQNGNKYVVIDGVDYIDDSGRNLSVDDEGLFYIGITGKIIAFDGSSVSKDYAYILEAAVNNSDPFSKGAWQLKLLTKNNGVVTYNLTDDASEYFASTYAAKLDLDVSTKDKQLFVELTDAQKGDSDRLITFKTNSRDYIKSFESATAVKGTTVRTLNSSSHEYNDRNQTIAGAPLEDNVVIYNLMNSSADNAYTTGINYLTDDGKYNGFVFANEDYEYCVMVVTSGQSAFTEETGYAIVTKVATTNDAYGYPVTKVSFVQNEKTYSVTFDDDADNRSGNDNAYASLKVGDVFAYNTRTDGIVSEYVILGTVSNGLFKINPLGADAFGDDTRFVYGYIANSSGKSNSGGQLITIKSDSDEELILVTSTSNKYTYNDAGRNVVIETEDFMAEDAYYFDPDTGEATYVFVKLVDDSVVDIYSFNKRVVLGTANAAANLIKAIGTVGYDATSLAKIEAAEKAYAELSSVEKAKIESEYKTLTAAREKYDELKKTAEDTAAADVVESIIAKLADITGISELESEIANAETAYAGLTDDQKKLVDNYSAIAEAKAALENKKAEADKAAADAAIAKINAIETVVYTSESKAKIDAARSAYDGLSDAQKTYVEAQYVTTLKDAEAEYKRLEEEAKNQKAAQEVTNVINALGTVTVADGDKITAAEKAYADLSPAQKALVNEANVAALINARTIYNSLKKAAEDKTAVEKVIELITKIGTVTATDDSKIVEAETAYGKLTDDQKALFAKDYADEYTKLTTARATHESLKNAAQQQNSQTEIQ